MEETGRIEEMRQVEKIEEMRRHFCLLNLPYLPNLPYLLSSSPFPGLPSLCLLIEGGISHNDDMARAVELNPLLLPELTEQPSHRDPAGANGAGKLLVGELNA